MWAYILDWIIYIQDLSKCSLQVKSPAHVNGIETSRVLKSGRRSLKGRRLAVSTILCGAGGTDINGLSRMSWFASVLSYIPTQYFRPRHDCGKLAQPRTLIRRKEAGFPIVGCLAVVLGNIFGWVEPVGPSQWPSIDCEDHSCCSPGAMVIPSVVTTEK